jgi:hypothetical protein
LESEQTVKGLGSSNLPLSECPRTPRRAITTGYKWPRRSTMPETRATYDEAAAAGLVALRGQGLEPDDFAKDLARKLAGHEITLGEMRDATQEHYRKRAHTVANTR